MTRERGWWRATADIGAALTTLAAGGRLEAQAAPVLEADNQVLSRPRPGIDPIGFRAGNLIVYPTLTGTASYDDNIYATDHDRVRSAILSVSPELKAVSESEQSAIELDASGIIERYTNRHTEDNERYKFAASGRYDALRAIRLDGEAHYLRSLEARGTLGDIFGAGEPIFFRRRGGTGGITFSLAQIDVRLGGEYDRITYENTRIGGVDVSQSYRDRDFTAADLKVSLNVSPSVRPFLEARQEYDRYDMRDRLTSFDSSSRIALAGFDVSVTKLLTGRVGIGYRWRDYRNYRGSNGLTYDLALVWNPRTLLSITAEAAKTIEESPSPVSSGVIRNSVSLTADYELLRRVILSASAGGVFEKYRSLNRLDKRFVGTFVARYLVNRFAQLDLRYDRTSQDGSGTFGRTYRDNTVGLALTLKR